MAPFKQPAYGFRMYNTSANSSTFCAPWLNITEISEVCPFETPFATNEHLVAPAQISIALFSKQAPAQQSYAIVDPHTFGDMAQLDDIEPDARRSLYTGASETEFSDAAPLLVRLDEESRVTRKFFTRLDGAPRHLGVHFWDRDSAIFLRSEQDIDEVLRHLRFFTRLKDQTGRWYVRRFWDAAHMRAWLPELAGDFVAAARFFGHLKGASKPVISAVIVPSPEDHTCLFATWCDDAVLEPDVAPYLPADRTQLLDDTYRAGLARAKVTRSVHKIAQGLRTQTFEGRSITRVGMQEHRALARACVVKGPKLGIQSEVGWARLTSIAAVLGAEFLDDPRYAARGLNEAQIRYDMHGEKTFLLGKGCAESLDQIVATSLITSCIPEASDRAVYLEVRDVRNVLDQVDPHSEWHWGQEALMAWAQRFLDVIGPNFWNLRVAYQMISLAYVHGLGLINDPGRRFAQIFAETKELGAQQPVIDILNEEVDFLSNRQFA